LSDCHSTPSQNASRLFLCPRYFPIITSNADSLLEKVMSGQPLHLVAVVVAAFLSLPLHFRAAQQTAKNDGYTSIFDGKSLKGWHVSAQTGHSRASKNKSGGRWVAEDGAIVGSQDVPGNGGIIITDKQDYKNFEVVLEMRNDFGPDSGLFLRCNDKGQ